jgi:hypothetical protein
MVSNNIVLSFAFISRLHSLLYMTDDFLERCFNAEYKRRHSKKVQVQGCFFYCQTQEVEGADLRRWQADSAWTL